MYFTRVQCQLLSNNVSLAKFTMKRESLWSRTRIESGFHLTGNPASWKFSEFAAILHTHTHMGSIFSDFGFHVGCTQRKTMTLWIPELHWHSNFEHLKLIGSYSTGQKFAWASKSETDRCSILRPVRWICNSLCDFSAQKRVSNRTYSTRLPNTTNSSTCRTYVNVRNFAIPIWEVVCFSSHSIQNQCWTQFTTRRAGLLSLDCPDLKAVKQLFTRTQQNSTILTEPLPKSPRDTACAFYQRPRLYYCWLKARGFKRSIRTLPESSKQQCLHQIFFWFESEY